MTRNRLANLAGLVVGVLLPVDACAQEGEQNAGTSAAPATILPPSAPILDPQSGLFLQTVRVANTTGADIEALLVLVGGLGQDSRQKDILLHNRQGITNGLPYVQYPKLANGAQVDLTLEYYVSDRITVPTPTFQTQSGRYREGPATGQVVFNVVRAHFTNGVMLVEFNTQAGALYNVQYTSNPVLGEWVTSLPGTIGTGSRVQWYDRGPPRTLTAPTNQVGRFYRILHP